MFYSFLFPNYCRGRVVSFLILALRIIFGILFFRHGLDKMVNFNELSTTYPSVLGFGSYMTLMLSIFAEFACSLFLIAGLLVRITVIPMIASMAVAFFDVHDGMMPQGELSLIYLAAFTILYVTGPGRYSVDYLIDMKFQRNKKSEEI